MWGLIIYFEFGGVDWGFRRKGVRLCTATHEALYSVLNSVSSLRSMTLHVTTATNIMHEAMFGSMSLVPSFQCAPVDSKAAMGFQS